MSFIQNAVENERPRILLVEDDASLRNVFKKLLEDRFEVHLAVSGEEGLDQITRQPPMAVIVSDYALPVMNGLDFLARAKKVSPRSIQIMLTGHDPAPITISGIMRGNLVRIVTKPLQHEEIVGMVVAAVEKWHTVNDP